MKSKNGNGRSDTNPGETAGGNVFSIAPGLPFLKTLAEALIDGRLVPGFDPANNPLALGEATVYLPTRRAARNFGVEILNVMRLRTGRDAVLLPAIRTIGDVDEEEILQGLGSDIPIDIGKPVNLERRQLNLAKLARVWSDALNTDSRELFMEEDIVLPSSAADAIRLASSIANFMDQCETAEIDWQQLQNIVGDDFAKWWQVTLTFLDIVMLQWPEVLKTNNEINPAEYRQRVINYRIGQLTKSEKKGPVISAGSTGSIPATSRLIAAIAGLENGAVVLPGMDHELPDEVCREIINNTGLGDADVHSTHPQYSLVRLAAKLNISPSNIKRLGKPDKPLAVRSALLNIALLPPAKSAEWLKKRSEFTASAIAEAFENVSIINAPGERQEALAIALLMRQALEHAGKTASLVTPDRNLVRRVASELGRFGIHIDDSGGAPLASFAPAMFIRQMLSCVFGEENPVALSAFLKSDFLLLGRSGVQSRKMAEHLELLLVREAARMPDIKKLGDATIAAFGRLDNAHHAPRLLRTLNEDDRSALTMFASDLSKALAELTALVTPGEKLTLSKIMAASQSTVIKLSENEDAKSLIFESTAGQMLEQFIASHSAIDSSNFVLDNFDVAPVVDALLAEKRVRDAARTHPRLQILGPLEARLQTSDLIIMGGLNEGTWPQLGSNDPFLNRPMRSELGLPLPELRIGLAAHDFQQLAANPEIVMTRSERVDNAPSIASRWLQRLTTFLGREQSQTIKLRGVRILDLVRQIDHSDTALPELRSPKPTPPVAARPKSLSITEIETWIRDPYAIYAKHVLQLQPLPPLVRDTDAALKGTLYHDIVADFVKEWRGEITEHAHARLAAIADRRFGQLELPEEIKSVWRPRFDVVAEDFLKWESERRANIATSHCEVAVNRKTEINGTGFTLRGRADRIDILKDGRISVIDYKTGSRPSNNEARTLSPQLALEGGLAMQGKFDAVTGGEIADLLYVRLREGGFKSDDISLDRNKIVKEPAAIISDAWENLKKLIAGYNNPEQGYASRYAPTFELKISGDYDHLARVREWSFSGDVDEESET